MKETIKCTLDHSGAARFRTPLIHIGRGWWITTEELYYNVGSIVGIRVPKYFLCDLASIPWFARWLLDRAGDSVYAAVIHDYLLDKDITSRLLADAIFREALIASSIPKWKRILLYLGVRIGAVLPGKIVPPEDIQQKAEAEKRRRQQDVNIYSPPIK